MILCHGFTANCNTELLTDIANDLQSDGIASLRFDFNGHGKSEGQFQDMTVLNEIQDLKMSSPGRRYSLGSRTSRFLVTRREVSL